MKSIANGAATCVAGLDELHEYFALFNKLERLRELPIGLARVTHESVPAELVGAFRQAQGERFFRFCNKSCRITVEVLDELPGYSISTSFVKAKARGRAVQAYG